MRSTSNLAIIVWVYGMLVLIGGVIGWVKAKSKPSLISGIAFGVALIVVGIGVDQGHSMEVWLAGGLAGLLAAIMGLRFAKTRKFMPAGLVAVLSVVVALLVIVALAD